MKRHRFQMTQVETEAIEAHVRGLNVADMVSHAAERCAQKHVDPADAVKALTCSQAIEIHNDSPGDVRVVMRWTPTGKQNSACVVVSLVRRCIITVWPNRWNDNHSTLDRSLYKWLQPATVTLAKL